MNLRMVILFVAALCACGFSGDPAVWRRANSGMHESDLRTIYVHPMNDNIIFAGTSNALYKSVDKGKYYREVLRPTGEVTGVNAVLVSSDDRRHLYAATDGGLYESLDEGQTWRRIYFSSDIDLRRSLSVLQDGNRIILGTGHGLFIQSGAQTGWDPVKQGIDGLPVRYMANDPDFIYLATDEAVFSMDKTTWTVNKIFTAGIHALPETGEDIDADESTDTKRPIRYMMVAGYPRTAIWIASQQGIYVSRDQGRHWDKWPLYNFPLNDVTSMVAVDALRGEDISSQSERFEGAVLLGTKKGVFFLNHGKWMPVYQGLETNNIAFLAKASNGTVYAATEKGIYFLSLEEALPSFYNVLNHRPGRLPAEDGLSGADKFKFEPSIQEVHRWAIEYAEVQPDKIKDWRVLARKKALLPDLSVGVDRDATDLFHWNTGANPDELQKGRELIDWDVSLSWDLGDYIWSTDQTTIDSRSKLMVELREDILNEVTRLYFERRRVQMDMGAPWNGESEAYTRVERQMRLAELTALIDALTGGVFSQEVYKNHP